MQCHLHARTPPLSIEFSNIILKSFEVLPCSNTIWPEIYRSIPTVLSGRLERIEIGDDNYQRLRGSVGGDYEPALPDDHLHLRQRRLQQGGNASHLLCRHQAGACQAIVQEIDPKAFIAIEHVSDVLGGGFEKSAIH